MGRLHWLGRGGCARCAAGTALFLSLTMAGALVPGQSHTSWSDYLGNADGSHYSALNQINRENVSKLQLAWTYAAGDDNPMGYVFNPLVVDDTAYVIARGGALVALDASSGKELWVHEFVEGGRRRDGAGSQRGLNYWESPDRSDRRILVQAGGFLQAIDARTGKLIESFGDHGRVNLKTGVDRAVAPVISRTPGRVFENLLIYGSATGEGYVSPPGDIRAFDVRTGRLVWVFHTVPRPGEYGYETWPKDAWKYIGGTNAWGEITIDTKRGIAYLPLGSPTYDFYGADRKGDGLFGNCVLALDARTGKRLWHFQMVHHDLWDYDASAAPQLITVRHDGKTVDAVAQAGKQGYLYVLDRVTGKPLWPIEERPVPKSDVPGEAASPTQPFPTAPPPFARMKFTVDDLNPYYLTDEERARWRAKILAARNEGVYTPPGFKETIEMPGSNGGANFFGTASDPASGYMYVVAKHVPAFLKLTENQRNLGPVMGVATEAVKARVAPANRGEEVGVPYARGPRAPASAAAVEGRAIYQQNCQACHGPQLRGNGAAPRLDNAFGRLGRDRVRDVVRQGGGEMPGFGAMPDTAMNSLLAYLADPSAVQGNQRIGGGLMFGATPYPPGVDVPKVRYYTGYGYEPIMISPPWSTLTAYDLNTGKIQWQIPYGDAPQAGPGKGPRGMIYPKSGVAVTAGGLIFYAGNDAVLHAVDRETGKELWSADLPCGSQGVPAIYETGGRQFVLVTATGGVTGIPVAPNGREPGSGKRVYAAFALPK